jgi:hypothetical protein
VVQEAVPALQRDGEAGAEVTTPTAPGTAAADEAAMVAAIMADVGRAARRLDRIVDQAEPLPADAVDLGCWLIELHAEVEAMRMIARAGIEGQDTLRARAEAAEAKLHRVAAVLVIGADKCRDMSAADLEDEAKAQVDGLNERWVDAAKGQDCVQRRLDATKADLVVATARAEALRVERDQLASLADDFNALCVVIRREANALGIHGTVEQQVVEMARRAKDSARWSAGGAAVRALVDGGIGGPAIHGAKAALTALESATPAVVPSTHATDCPRRGSAARHGP